MSIDIEGSSRFLGATSMVRSAQPPRGAKPLTVVEEAMSRHDQFRGGHKRERCFG